MGFLTSSKASLFVLHFLKDNGRDNIRFEGSEGHRLIKP